MVRLSKRKSTRNLRRKTRKLVSGIKRSLKSFNRKYKGGDGNMGRTVVDEAYYHADGSSAGYGELSPSPQAGGGRLEATVGGPQLSGSPWSDAKVSCNWASNTLEGSLSGGSKKRISKRSNRKRSNKNSKRSNKNSKRSNKNSKRSNKNHKRSNKNHKRE